MHELSLGDADAVALGLCVRVRLRAGLVLRAREDLSGVLVTAQGADVVACTPDPSRGGEDGGREQDRSGRNRPPDQDRKHESAD